MGKHSVRKKIVIIIFQAPAANTAGSPSTGEDPDKKKSFWDTEKYKFIKEVFKWIPVGLATLKQLNFHPLQWLHDLLRSF